MTVYERFTGEQGEYAMDDNWIDVDESLPKFMQYVLVAREIDNQDFEYEVARLKSTTVVTHLGEDGKVQDAKHQYWADSWGNTVDPDYWQPITPPAGKDGGK
jgi:hypothetical protein